jgi:hypothetical protein
MRRDSFPDVVRRWVGCPRISPASPSSLHVSLLVALRQSIFAGSWHIYETAMELHDAAFEAKTLKSKSSIEVRQLVVAQPLQKARPGSVASSYCGTAARQRQPDCNHPNTTPLNPTPRRKLTIATALSLSLSYKISPQKKETKPQSCLGRVRHPATRLRKHHRLTGHRLQEGRQSRDDTGPHEDGPGRAHE